MRASGTHMRGNTNQIGTALMGLGGGAASILGGLSTVNAKTLAWWHHALFLAPFVAGVVLFLIGVYTIFAGVIEWLPPRGWTSPRAETEAPSTKGMTIADGDYVARDKYVVKRGGVGKFVRKDKDD